jgi:hypothetical protein
MHVPFSRYFKTGQRICCMRDVGRLQLPGFDTLSSFDFEDNRSSSCVNGSCHTLAKHEAVPVSACQLSSSQVTTIPHFIIHRLVIHCYTHCLSSARHLSRRSRPLPRAFFGQSFRSSSQLLPHAKHKHSLHRHHKHVVRRHPAILSFPLSVNCRRPRLPLHRLPLIVQPWHRGMDQHLSLWNGYI